MIDFSKIFDIVFASVAVALMLFLLISTIAVAARGKRKCGGFDIFLRIVATLVLIVAAVMFAAAILTMLDGAFRIMLVSQSAEKTAVYLVMNGKQIELPLVDLFIVLSSVVGSNIVAMLLICALAALIVDCVVANKKDAKTKVKTKKTPEQIKREAELARIKRIGESAVRKADAAASQDTATTEQRDDEPQPDWREEQPKEQEHTEFVGIKDDEPDDFDSFDEPAQDNEQGDSDQAFTGAQEQAVTDDGAEEPIADEFVDGLAQDEYTEDATVEEEFFEEHTETEETFEEEVYTDEFTDETAEEAVDEATEDEFGEEEVLDSEQIDEQELVEEEILEEEILEEQTETEEAFDELVEEHAADEDDMSGWAYESDETVAEEQAYQTEEQETATEVVDGESKDDDIAPDRNIYFPEMRTIEPAPKKATAKSTEAKKTSSKPKPKTAAKPKKASNQAAKKQKAVPPEKKLPVTRKYVILDRHNAVNMFGEYLKERNRAQKEKLESSIDTIIIE